MIYGIYRKLFENDGGELVELWSNEHLAHDRMCQLINEHRAYHWYYSAVKINTGKDIKPEQKILTDDDDDDRDQLYMVV